MRRFQITTVLLIGMAAFLTGCSRNPVAPLSNPANGGAQNMSIQTDEPGSTVEGGIGSEVTGTFSATDEARLTVGRFTLDLHKNTLKMPATITLRVASDDAMEVEIEVVPAEANDFQVPAELWANMSDQPETDFPNSTIFAWEQESWKDAEGSGHANMQAVVGKFKHLSTSRIGQKENKAEVAVARQ
jgi:hypothetical protein